MRRKERKKEKANCQYPSVIRGREESGRKSHCGRAESQGEPETRRG